MRPKRNDAVSDLGRELQLPLDAAAAALVLVGDREGVARPVGQGAHLEQREEPVALEHGAPVDAPLAEVGGAGATREMVKSCGSG